MDILSERIKRLPASATLTMAAKARELKNKGIDVIGLSLGEPDFNTPEFIKDAAIKAVNDNYNSYSPVDGYLDLKKSLNKKSIKVLENYYDNIFNLSETLFKSIIKIYNLDIVKSKIAFRRQKTLSTLRFNFYPNQTKPVEISKQDGVALGCETHVDSGIFTVLYQDKKGGLQVQNRNNKKWYDVPFNRNALIVNTGLALEFLSKGKFKATNHRVLWNKTKRMSIPFFFEPSYDFKMNKSFFTNKPNHKKGLYFEKFLNLYHLQLLV